MTRRQNSFGADIHHINWSSVTGDIESKSPVASKSQLRGKAFLQALNSKH